MNKEKLIRYVWIVFVFLTNSLFAQERGVMGVEDITPNKTSVTRALVVGISKYKHKSWNLNYAHSDAQKIAGFLASDFGGNLTSDQLYLITDSLATSFRIKIALNKLVKESRASDELVLFFAGHGVQESDATPSYLITHETPFENNFNSGSISFDYIQKVIDSLTQRNVKVTLIADVCRSGNFASFTKENQKRAATKLLELQNEVRMLSCLPDEVSYEDVTWEGGVFTHYLLEGLLGKADEIVPNKLVSGRELERFVELGVQLEIEKFNNGRQTPQFVLGKNGRKELSQLVNYKGVPPAEIHAHQTGTKQLIAAFLKFESSPKADDLYQQFQEAIAEKRIAYQLPNSALKLYEELKTDETVKVFLPIIFRNLAIVVLEEANKQIDNFLSEQVDPITSKKCKEIATSLEYTLKWSVLDQEINKEIESLMYFYQGAYLKKKAERMDYANWQKDIEVAFSAFHKALALNPNATYINHELGFLYMITHQFEQAEIYFLKAIQETPKFSYSYINLGNVYHFTNRPEKADSISREAVKVNKRNPISLYNLGIILSRQGKLNRAALAFKQAIKLRPDYLDAYHKLAFLHLETGAISEAHNTFIKAYALDKKNLKTLFGMARTKAALGNTEETLGLVTKCLEVEPNFIPAHFLASDIYLTNNVPDSAIIHLNKILGLSPNNIDAFHFLAFIYANKGAFSKAEEYCKSILDTAPLRRSETYLTGLKTLNLLGLILLKQKKLNKAKEVLEAALPGADDYPKIYCNLASVYRAMRMKKEAKSIAVNAFTLGEECRNRR